MENVYVVDTIALKKLMVEREISTITQLVELSGLNRGTVTGVLDGTYRPSAKTIEKFAEVLAIPPCDIGPIFFKQELA